MAKLPQTIEMQGPNARVGAGSVLSFDSLDNALQGAARQIQQVDQARRETDEVEAARVVEEARQSWALGAGERAYAYDGREPGYAEAELKTFDDHFAATQNREDLPDGVKMAVGRRLRELRTETAGSLIATEARTRGQRSAADREASEQATAVRALMDVQAAFDEMEDRRRQEWDGVAPGFADGLRSDWRTAAEQALSSQPEAVQARLRPMLLSQEASLLARGLAAEDQSRDARTLTTVGEGLNAFVNRAARDPSLMSRFDAETAPMLEAAPASLRAKLRQDTWSQAQTAALDARIQRGEFDQVEQEIKAGRYDALDARTLDRLKDGVRSARANGVVTDAQAAADLEAAIQADLRGVLEGRQPDRTLQRQALLIGGEGLAAKVRIDQEAALNVRPLMGRLRTMRPDQAAAELETLTKNADDAVGARTLELAREMVAQDAAARADPAAWTATSVGPGDRVAEAVRGRLRAFSDAPSPETALAYANATWIAQQQAGVPLQQRRVLSGAMAEAWVQGVTENGGVEQGLADLARRASLFGREYRPQVMRELALAGLSPADQGALAHYAASPSRLRLYAQARGQKPTDLVPTKAERDALDADLQEALKPWAEALSSREGAEAALEAAKVTAYGMVSRGERPRDAVRTATAAMTNGWTFFDGWAVPDAAGVEPRRIRGNAGLLVANLLRNRGEGLATPPSDRFTPEQSRRSYADVVRSHGRWRNLPDGSGVQLVTPAADGSRFLPVRDARGQEVRRTWQQLATPPRR